MRERKGDRKWKRSIIRTIKVHQVEPEGLEEWKER